MATLNFVTIDNVTHDLADRVNLAGKEELTSTATYAHSIGEYFIYDGLVYEVTQDIAIGNTITPNSNCQRVVIGNKIKTLKTQIENTTEIANSVFNVILPTNLAVNTTYTAGKCIRYDNGDTRNSSLCKVTDYIDITSIESISYNKILFTESTTLAGIAFYTSAKAYISGVQAKVSQAAAGTEISVEAVPANTKYIRLSVFTADSAQLFDAADYAAKVYPRLDRAESDIAEGKKFDARVTDTLDDGYYRIPIDRWALNGWNGYNSKDSRAYRVRCLDVLTFDVDTYIMADKGYRVGGWDSAGNAFGGTETKVPAGTSVVIYSRRFTENASEVISDITPFVNAIKFASVLAPIEQLKPTFTDVSMFERIGIGGDSYAAGGGIISGVTALTWGKNLSRQAGIDVDIYAKSGQNVVEWVTDANRGLPALLAGEECGLYWLQHGINGTPTPEALGTAADMSASPHPATFYGQYVEAIEQIKTAFPNARIVLATIIGTSYGLYQSLYKDVNTAIRAIAQYCEVPCIDVADDDFYRSNWYQNNSASNHPTAMTAAGMAAANRRLISKCIQDNPAYFINYGSNN